MAYRYISDTTRKQIEVDIKRGDLSNKRIAEKYGYSVGRICALRTQYRREAAREAANDVYPEDIDNIHKAAEEVIKQCDSLNAYLARRLPDVMRIVGKIIDTSYDDLALATLGEKMAALRTLTQIYGSPLGSDDDGRKRLTKLCDALKEAGCAPDDLGQENKLPDKITGETGNS